MSKETPNTIYYDTETTGVRTDKDKIVEIAAYNPDTKEEFVALVNPGQPIPQEASAIHHITDEMVQDAPSFQAVGQQFAEFCGEKAFLIAHNGDSFDMPLLKSELQRHQLSFPEWISLDTLKWARKYRPDLPRHSLQHLREIHGIPPNNAHRALDDVIILHQVFSLMIDDLSISKVYQLLTEKPATLKMPFGKYKGRPLKDVPQSYISWLMKSGALDKPENQELFQEFESLGLL